MGKFQKKPKYVKTGDKKLDFMHKVRVDHPTFTDSLEGLAKIDLDKNMALYAKYVEDTRFTLINKEEIKKIRDEFKLVTGPYREALNIYKIKLKYINFLVREKEGLDDGEERVEKPVQVAEKKE